MQFEPTKSSPAHAPGIKPEIALEQLWVETLQYYTVDPSAGREIFKAIVDAHSAPDRHYHNLRHLHEMAEYLQPIRHLLNRPEEAALAILFHDFVYDSKGKTNEEQSATAARNFLTPLGISEDVQLRVEALILATKKHQPLADNPDSRYFLDADLAILGREPERYAEYAADIRREYGWVLHDQYCSGRATVMAGFLDRPAIYFNATPERAHQARENIGREIALLATASDRAWIDWTQF